MSIQPYTATSEVDWVRRNTGYQKDIFEITVIYKSGNKMSFLTSSFEIERKGAGKTATWKDLPGGDHHRPIHLNLDEVESIWQTGYWKGEE